MLYKSLAVSTVRAINIGDYVQALAASQFYPQIDGFVEREHLDEYHGDHCKMIMNAYYMHDGNHWPPSSQIKPLFIAMHVNSLVRDAFSRSDSIEYLKKHAPIGCRDYGTLKFLQSLGVDAYFSGCLTLTLGRNYEYNGERQGVFFVDPHVTFASKLEKGLYYLYSFLINDKVNVIGKKYFKHTDLSPRERSFISKFFVKYKKVFTEDTIINANYETQESSYYNTNFNTNAALLNEAERLIKMYSKAALVVTSRIHCALPCLGMNVPVIYINNKLQSEASECRLKGLRDLFNVIHWSNEGVSLAFEHKGLLSESNHPVNSTEWKNLAENLSKRCVDFVTL